MSMYSKVHDQGPSFDFQFANLTKNPIFELESHNLGTLGNLTRKDLLLKPLSYKMP